MHRRRGGGGSPTPGPPVNVVVVSVCVYVGVVSRKQHARNRVFVNGMANAARAQTCKRTSVLNGKGSVRRERMRVKMRVGCQPVGAALA